MNSEKVNGGYYESVVNYSPASMSSTREKLLEAKEPFLIDGRGYVDDYLIAWGIIAEDEIRERYDEYVFEYSGVEFTIFIPKGNFSEVY